MIDFITSLEGYGAADGWPGLWGMDVPEYLAWLEDQPEADYAILMGANTYRLMLDLAADGEPGIDALTEKPKIVFSSTLTEPLSWPNTQLVAQDAVEAVRDMKDNGTDSMRTLGSLTLCRSLLKAGLVDRYRRGRLPSDHRKQWQRPDLRRVPRRRPRDGEQPRLRRSAAAARVRPDGSGWATRRKWMTSARPPVPARRAYPRRFSRSRCRAG